MTLVSPVSKFLLVSTGSGVSPILALYQRLVTDPTHRIANLFGEAYFSSIVPELLEAFQDGDHIRHFLHLSRDEQVPDGWRSGRIQQSLEEAVQFLGDPEAIQVFLCGKPEMVVSVQEILLTMGFSPTQIKSEKY